MAEKNAIGEFEFKAEMKQLLHLIIHSLYTHSDIFLRELVSNASDALNKFRFLRLSQNNLLEPEKELRIDINVDLENKSFSIEDSGIGMTKQELIDQIGTVANSGTLAFLQKMKESGESIDSQMIGQFGVGFYSVFMVTDEVLIETRHATSDSEAFVWKSTGGDKFTIERSDREARGTKISFSFKKENQDYAELQRIKGILRKYSNFVDFPIYLNGEKVNIVSALWHKKKDKISDDELEEFYKFLTNDFKKPIGHLQLSLEGNINLKALLFIPESVPELFLRDFEKTIHLYSSKVLIQDDAKDLLPEYLQFVKGVVDTEDLPLNVSREVIQSSPLIIKIKNILTSKLLSLFEDWSKDDFNKFKQFYQSFGKALAMGLNSDFEHREKIIDLLRFDSSKLSSGELRSLKEYKVSMADDQKEIFYSIGNTRTEILKNPKIEYFLINNIEVLILDKPSDYITLPYMQSYDGFSLKSIEKADITKQESPNDALGEDASNSLINHFKNVLGDRVEDVLVSNRLIDSPATLVSGKHSLDIHIEKLFQAYDNSYEGSKKIFEINTAHPLIKNLSLLQIAGKDIDLLNTSIIHLFEGALLLEGALQSAAEYVKRMNELMVRATKDY